MKANVIQHCWNENRNTIFYVESPRTKSFIRIFPHPFYRLVKIEGYNRKVQKNINRGITAYEFSIDVELEQFEMLFENSNKNVISNEYDLIFDTLKTFKVTI